MSTEHTMAQQRFAASRIFDDFSSDDTGAHSMTEQQAQDAVLSWCTRHTTRTNAPVMRQHFASECRVIDVKASEDVPGSRIGARRPYVYATGTTWLDVAKNMSLAYPDGSEVKVSA